MARFSRGLNSSSRLHNPEIRREHRGRRRLRLRQRQARHDAMIKAREEALKHKMQAKEQSAVAKSEGFISKVKNKLKNLWRGRGA